MFKTEVKIRVRYAETDQMNYVYYGRYAEYFEVARVEALRELGLSYKKMENEGIMLPVLSYNVKYIKPAYYDDLLTLETTIAELPSSRITFYYNVINEKGDLVCKAETTLVFINKLTGKPGRPPESLLEKLSPFFND